MTVLTMTIEEGDDERETLTCEWDEDLSLVEQLGYLEWAKAISVEAARIENALAAYGGDES